MIKVFEEELTIIQNTIEEQKNIIDTNQRLIQNLQIALMEMSIKILDLQGENDNNKTNISHILKYNGMKGRDLTLVQELVDNHNTEIISLKKHLHELELNKKEKDTQLELI